MLDQLIVGAIRSYDDYEASIAEREIIDGAKKTIRETVPFSNKTYDFSKIDGELYWENKTLKYTFEITADSPEELADKVMKFKNWIMNVMEEKLHDPFITDYHFIATFTHISVNTKEVEKAVIAVEFTAYPYMMANVPKEYNLTISAGKNLNVAIVNNSSHRITPTFNSDIAFNVTKGNETFGVPSGETTDEYFKLEAGVTNLTLSATESGSVAITFTEEVF